MAITDDQRLTLLEILCPDTDRPMPKPGRPRSEHPLRYQVRHSAEQMAAWEAAAQAEERELQNWIRRTLDAAAKKAARKP